MSEERRIPIELTQGYTAYVDSIDADLADFKWCIRKGKQTVYAVHAVRVHPGKGGQRIDSMHRIILSRILNRTLLNNEMVDHIDGNGWNNLRSNLRLATAAENQHNRRRGSNNKSGYKGVCSDPAWRGKWKAQIAFNKKVIRLGHYDTPESAHEAYCKAAAELFGEFARTI